MKNILWVSDFFYPEVKGGAERYDKVAIKLLEYNLDVKKVKSRNFGVGHLNAHDDRYIIFSNFAAIGVEAQKKLLQSGRNYMIIEHDYKLAVSRQPQKYENYDIPQSKLRNVDFYRNADVVLLQSSLQKKIFEKNVPEANYRNFSGSLWEISDINFMQALAESTMYEPPYDAAVIDSDNPIKGKQLAIDYCEDNDLTYDLIGGEDQEQFFHALCRQGKKFIYLPLTPESLGRVAVEARMLGREVVCHDKVGAKHEEWFHWEPEEIREEMKDRNRELDCIIAEYADYED